MEYMNRPVAYLQRSDFDSSGNLINNRIPRDKVVLIMIQAGFCGYCTQAKPAFQRLANRSPDIFCATIQGDGKEEGEKEIKEILEAIHPGFQGYPSYVAYMGGRRVGVHTGGRGEEELRAFVENLR